MYTRTDNTDKNLKPSKYDHIQKLDVAISRIQRREEAQFSNQIA